MLFVLGLAGSLYVKSQRVRRLRLQENKGNTEQTVLTDLQHSTERRIGGQGGWPLRRSVGGTGYGVNRPDVLC